MTDKPYLTISLLTSCLLPHLKQTLQTGKAIASCAKSGSTAINRTAILFEVDNPITRFSETKPTSTEPKSTFFYKELLQK